MTDWKEQAVERATEAARVRIEGGFSPEVVARGVLAEANVVELVEAGEALRKQTIVSEVMSASGSILPRRVVSPPDVETYEAFVAALSKVTGGSDGD